MSLKFKKEVLIVQWPATFVKLIVKKRKGGPYVAWIMLLMNPDAIFIKLYAEENKLDYSTEENAPNVSVYPTTTRYLFGYITRAFRYQSLFSTPIHFR